MIVVSCQSKEALAKGGLKFTFFVRHYAYCLKCVIALKICHLIYYLTYKGFYTT